MNFPNFPLYETLKKNIFIELTNEEKDKVIDKLKLMTDEKQEIVYALIKAYHIEEQTFIKEALPYNGKVLKQRIKFDLDHLPSKLQFILKCFSEIK
jgi:hypothetical protein